MKNALKVIKPFVVKHQPEILMSMGIAGMIFSTISGVKATIKSSNKISKLRETKNLTKKEVIKETWKYYIPTAVSMAVSIPCIIAGNRISNTRNMALAAAYTISETALQEYQDKTKELLGEKKYDKLQESVSQELVSKNYNPNNVTIIGNGDSIFFEPLSGRFFQSNWNTISKAANELNSRALSDLQGVIYLGDWYDILGLEPTELDTDLGWNVLDGTKGIIDISIDTTLTPDNKPCGAIRYNTRPKKL